MHAHVSACMRHNINANFIAHRLLKLFKRRLAVKPDRVRRFRSPSNFRNIITEVGFHRRFVHNTSRTGREGRNEETHKTCYSHLTALYTN